MPKVAQMFPKTTSLAEAVTDALAAVTLTPADTGAVKLAQDYAAAIDAADDRGDALERLGPKLLAALDVLGATPAARAKATKATGTPDKPVSQLQKMRDARGRK